MIEALKTPNSGIHTDICSDIWLADFRSCTSSCTNTSSCSNPSCTTGIDSGASASCITITSLPALFALYSFCRPLPCSLTLRPIV
jgi:hypothetical protein